MRGIIVGADFDTLVVQATAAEVAAFGAKQPVEVRPQWGARTTEPISPGERLYNVAGIPVAIVHRIHHHLDSIDATSFNDAVTRSMRGHVHTQIEAVGIEYGDG